MSAQVRPLPGSFAPWLDLSRDDEVLALLDLVKSALTRRECVVALAVERVERSS